MPIFQRLGEILREDLGALLPGGGAPFTRETFLRLLLYAAFLLLIVRTFLPGPDLFSGSGGRPADEFWRPEQMQPQPDGGASPGASQVEDPQNI